MYIENVIKDAVYLSLAEIENVASSYAMCACSYHVYSLAVIKVAMLCSYLAM